MFETDATFGWWKNPFEVISTKKSSLKANLFHK